MCKFVAVFIVPQVRITNEINVYVAQWGRGVYNVSSATYRKLSRIRSKAAMDELIATIVDTLKNAGGSMEYRALYEATDGQDRRLLASALQLAQSKRLLLQVVSYNKETHAVTHSVRLQGG